MEPTQDQLDARERFIKHSTADRLGIESPNLNEDEGSVAESTVDEINAPDQST